MVTKHDELAAAIWGTLQSVNEQDSNWEAANVVDGLYRIQRAIDRHVEAIKILAEAIRPGVCHEWAEAKKLAEEMKR